MDESKRETSAHTVASEFLARLRKKGNDLYRIKIAKELYEYINGELRDQSDQFQAEFFATFDAKIDQSAIHALMLSTDNDERKAGIILIVASEFLARLRKKGNDLYRIKIAKELYEYINGELRDQSDQFQAEFFATFDAKIDQYKKNMVNFAVCLVENAGDETKRVPRFAKYLLRALMQGDEAGMKLAARAIAYLIQTSKTFAAELVEKSMNQVCEWLEEPERNESRRLAAAFLARQLALYTSTSFFLRASNFFSNIFKVIRDPKASVRIAATKALHAALTVTTQREASQKSEWYWVRSSFGKTQNLAADDEEANKFDVDPVPLFNHALNMTAKHPPAFFTIGLLVLDRPTQLQPKLGLTDVAYEIIQSVPGLKTEAQDGMLKELCQLLMNRKLPSKLAPPTEPPMPSGPVHITNVPLISLALATLGRFEFQRHALQMFINYIAHVRKAFFDCNTKK
ncbi:unnamed protein product [Gongylonema pulchrum]|uniref:Non-specific serine/threonine protein kinase n=1 Tax=Gongylonema pulchrum TaxID=637853 RepID=A0A183DUV6_9BILA|nr:unnamed protein product [Gongylonema pulchrum]